MSGKYETIKSLLKNVGVVLPEDTSVINEWSLIMVMTGVLIGIDKNLVPGNDIVVHASGFYCKDDYIAVGKDGVNYIKNSEDMYSLLVKK